MGMYDEIMCYYPLPELTEKEILFQTKHFNNVLDKYTITEEGRLIHHTCHWEMVSEKDRPYYGKPEWDKNPFYQLAGSLKTIPDGDVDTGYHGIFRMYTSIKEEWFEYEFKFTDGKLAEVKRLYKEYGNG